MMLHSHSSFFVPVLVGVLVLLLATIFIAITFIQSGLDKVFDYKGNLSWIKEQFSTTFLRGTIGIFLPVIMIGELAGGLLCLIGIFRLFYAKEVLTITGGLALCGLVLLLLLFGQRVSKQYAGAASLTGYFIIVLIGLVAAMFLGVVMMFVVD